MTSIDDELKLYYFYKSKYIIDDNNLIIKNVKKMLTKIDNTSNRLDKLDICRQIFSYLIVNKYFINDHIKFKNTVQDKLKYFYKYDNWTAASEIYYYYLFNETIDGNKNNIENNIEYKFEKLLNDIENL